MIPRLVAAVDPRDLALCVQEQDATLLKGRALRSTLPEAGQCCASGMDHDGWRERAPDVVLESQGLVSVEVRCHVEGRRYMLLGLEVERVGGFAAADEDEANPEGVELRLDATQLSGLLTAEQSAKVAQKDHHHGAVVAKIRE